MESAPPRPFSLAKANTEFFLALFKKLNDKDKTANSFHSPLSISAALAMVLLGTSGNTAAQMSKVLGFSESDKPEMEREAEDTTASRSRGMVDDILKHREQTRQTVFLQSRLPCYLQELIKPTPGGSDDVEVHAEFFKLLEKLKNEALDVANSLYGELSYEFIGHFLAQTKKYYGAELKSVDFISKAEEARVTINNWVDEKTKGNIKEVLVPGVVDSMTKLVLVNAIYFKSRWSVPFKEEDTVEEQFRVNKEETKVVKMMRMKRKFPINVQDEDKIKVLEIPYEGNELSMIILLPDDIADDTTGLEKLEKDLTFANFVRWTRPDAMNQVEVDVKLPRFKLETRYDLKDVLKSMGMVDAFDVSLSNFSGMSSANDLVLSKVIHAAHVVVDEEGTEAAAVSAPVVSTRSLSRPLTFTADHPFLFFIRHTPSKTVLFAGRYCVPE